MDAVTAARAQMGVSLAFHMVFAALGIGLPLLMVLAEGLGLRTGKRHYFDLARTWGKATALLFVVGAVSGTALSFELGLLWPHFMEFAGPIVGPAFMLEGFAFFLEAIFIGLYLYGWDRLSPRAHWWTGVPVAVSGAASGAVVVAVNAWMQVPVGFELIDGRPENIDPLATFRSPGWPVMAVHSTLACYAAVGFAVAGVYALGVLRGRRDAYHLSALNIALAVGAGAVVFQPLSGDFAARNVVRHQPAKLAAMEAHFETRSGAPLVLGGIADVEERRVRWGIYIPYGLSLLADHDPNAVVKGLEAFPRDQWPNVTLVHLAFDLMVGCGFALMALGLWYGWSVWRGRVAENVWLLRCLVLGAPLGMLALEAGWMVTELGRQPWIIYGTMRTAGAVTPAPGLEVYFWVFTALYAGLAVLLVVLLRGLAAARGDGHAG